jgi:hypothetical protein
MTSGMIDTTFPNFVTIASMLSHLGSFTACARIDAIDSTGFPIDAWPFAGSVCVPIFGIRPIGLPRNYSSNDYSVTASGPIPDHRFWASLGARVVEGQLETWDPPPPHDDIGFGPDSLRSPVIRLDRADVNGFMYGGANIGDTLKSFPSSLTGQAKFVLSFDFMRGGKHRYPALYDMDTMLGPEHPVLKNGSVVRPGDSLLIEFNDPAGSKCNPSKWNRIAGIAGGKDFEFQSFWLLVDDSTGLLRITGMEPQTIQLGRNYLDSAFRFRLRVKASDSRADFSRDDDDPWYIDNITLAVPRLPEIEVMWTRVVTPYTKIPYTAAAHLPVYFKIKDPFSAASVGFPMKTIIVSDRGDTVYEETQLVTIGMGVDSVIRMPDWSAQTALTRSTQFTVISKIGSNGYDAYTDDNETFSTFYLNVERGDSAFQEYAFDDLGMRPQVGVGNDMALLAKTPGTGVGFHQTTGSYAMKFPSYANDTLIGARLYFGSSDLAGEPIRISVLKSEPSSCIPGDTVMTYQTQRGPLFDQFMPYYFPTPIVLPSGDYWLSVSQLSANSFALGSDFSRGSGSIVVGDLGAPDIEAIYTSPYGTQWSTSDNHGAVNCVYAVETPAGSGQWQPWMPTTGLWPTNLAGSGNPSIGWGPQLSGPFIKGGSFLPLIRPLVGTENPQKRVRHATTVDRPLECFPNPFSPQSNVAKVQFTLNDAAVTSVAIYNSIGQHLRTLFAGRLESGPNTIYWDGRDANGRFVATGVYVIRLTSKDLVCSTQLIITE